MPSISNVVLVNAFVPYMLVAYGLGDWQFKWDESLTQHGSCEYETKTIYFSRPVALTCTEADMYETVLHEFAHAWTPDELGNDGPIWRAVARSFGCEAVETWLPDVGRLPGHRSDFDSDQNPTSEVEYLT